MMMNYFLYVFLYIFVQKRAIKYTKICKKVYKKEQRSV